MSVTRDISRLCTLNGGINFEFFAPLWHGGSVVGVESKNVYLWVSGTRDEMRHAHVYLWNKNLNMQSGRKQSAKTPLSGDG